MSIYWPGSMRGLRAVKTPLLLLLLLSTLTGTVLCQHEDTEYQETTTQEVETADPPPDHEDGDGPGSVTNDPDASSTSEVPTDESGSGLPSTVPIPQEIETTIVPDVSNQSPDEPLSPVIILIPVVLVVVIIGMIVCGIFINRRLNNNTRNQELKKEDPYLDGPSTEKVPMPMFEEDVPSVLELEMEELDQWMKKDGKSTEDSAQA